MTIDYPDIRPTSRNFDPGNWPVRTYNAQNGAEVRILYGSQKYNLKLQLSYQNITDANAEAFLDHFNDRKGTYSTFTITSDVRVAALSGWSGNKNALSPPTGVNWRYAKPPEVVSVRPGISTVNVFLVGVI